MTVAPYRIPNFYRPPFGLPLFWQDEVSGVLPAAIWAYINHVSDHTQPAPSPDQLSLIIEYARHYIHAPCWDCDAFVEELAQLRSQAQALQTIEDVSKFVDGCMEIGCDPF